MTTRLYNHVIQETQLVYGDHTEHFNINKLYLERVVPNADHDDRHAFGISMRLDVEREVKCRENRSLAPPEPKTSTNNLPGKCGP